MIGDDAAQYYDAATTCVYEVQLLTRHAKIISKSQARAGAAASA